MLWPRLNEHKSMKTFCINLAALSLLLTVLFMLVYVGGGGQQ